MQYLRANGYKTYIVTGGGQAFVRTYAEQTYGIPPEQIIGSALETQFTVQRGRRGDPDATAKAAGQQQLFRQG